MKEQANDFSSAMQELRSAQSVCVLKIGGSDDRNI